MKRIGSILYQNRGFMYVFFIQVTSDLFDIMSGQTDIDHPLCEECTDTLLDHLDTQLSITENECQNYKLVSLTLISSNLLLFFFLILWYVSFPWFEGLYHCFCH